MRNSHVYVCSEIAPISKPEFHILVLYVLTVNIEPFCNLTPAMQKKKSSFHCTFCTEWVGV